jgi:hypothetical protein
VFGSRALASLQIEAFDLDNDEIGNDEWVAPVNFCFIVSWSTNLMKRPD